MARIVTALVALVLFAATSTGSLVTLSAQEATPSEQQPTAQQFPITPDPANCIGEPVAAEDLLSLWYGPDGEQVTVASPESGTELNEVIIPLGTPADEATTAEVISVIQSIFSCFAAGDSSRAYGQFSDNLRIQFGPEPGTPREDAEAFLAASPVPESEEEASTLVAITDVSMLDDGSIGAFVIEEFGGHYSSTYAILIREGDRLVVDQVIEFSSFEEEEEGTPTS